MSDWSASHWISGVLRLRVSGLRPFPSSRYETRGSVNNLQRHRRRGLDYRVVGYDPVFGDDHNAVADVVERVVDVLRFAGGRDDAVIPDPRVLIDDRVLDPRVEPDADPRAPRFF